MQNVILASYDECMRTEALVMMDIQNVALAMRNVCKMSFWLFRFRVARCFSGQSMGSAGSTTIAPTHWKELF